MMDTQICNRCPNADECQGSCEAYDMLQELVQAKDKELKKDLLKQYKDDLQLIYAEPDPELEALAEKIIDLKDELYIIKDLDISIGYVRSTEAKRANKKLIYGDCRKVNEVYKAYLPFDFIITFYADSLMLSENQLKVLMLHELKHIDIGPRGYTMRPHDVEDFIDILMEYGLDWDNLGGDTPDILEEVKTGGE